MLASSLTPSPRRSLFSVAASLSMRNSRSRMLLMVLMLLYFHCYTPFNVAGLLEQALFLSFFIQAVAEDFIDFLSGISLFLLRFQDSHGTYNQLLQQPWLPLRYRNHSHHRETVKQVLVLPSRLPLWRRSL